MAALLRRMGCPPVQISPLEEELAKGILWQPVEPQSLTLPFCSPSPLSLGQTEDKWGKQDLFFWHLSTKEVSVDGGWLRSLRPTVF